MQFSHLHCHTQYSLLDGQADIKKLIKKAKADNMPAVAITDHGNMFGVFEFVAEASKQGIKPIVGCEFYVVEDHTIKQFTKEKKDVRYHQLLLAKNAQGYKNLAKLCSLGYMEGLYGKYPRVTKELIDKYKEGLIASTCCIGASVPKTILKKGEAAGEIEFKWWLDRFGEDYYVELQRHEIPDQIKANEVLIKFARKYNVKIIASNDSHYVDQDDWVAHDILLCVNTNEKQSTPSMKDFSDDDVMPKNTRFAFFSDQFYFKNTQEMTTLFKDLPEAIDNTNEIVGKVETLKLKRDIMLPNFPIPKEFQQHTDDVLNQWEYLRHLTYEGAKERYVDILPHIQERLDFELFTIRTMGFAGYFLIVADFIKAGRDLGVMIGPGRGSAAGSAVAYCTGITNIDPIKYDLLFERFLNPDRKSMPDIDTDFDDEGRQKVIDYVVQKYGKAQVAQIVTYGTMASKSSIKDVARVMDLPLQDANAVVKLVPDKPTYNMTLKRIFEDPLDGPGGLASVIQPEELDNVKRMRALESGDKSAAQAMRIVDYEKVSAVLKQARKLEGTVRNTGLHAAGIIIAPSDLSDIVPVSTSKDTNLIITQYEGKVIEDAGVIKMDFLGLRNLTIIKECLRLIRQNHGGFLINGVETAIDDIPLDDEETYKLFQRGETNGVFQFESDGMKKHMKDLKPDRFGDLIAMNALYRPGPIAYIPNYINRKHGREEVKYDMPEMEEYLADTYGITVYQEQLMLLSQKLGNFTKGDADVLRKAMGKKDKATLDKMKGKFMDGCASNNLPLKVCEKVWTDWEAFASYAFNKSHSTCYAFVAYQTAFLKAHYRPEYMAAVLTSCLGTIDKITFFMEECKNINIPVLGPDVNESERFFGVNQKGEIRFGLGGIKGAGDAAVEAIIDERKAGGPFKDIFDFAIRVNLRTVNKKTWESLAYAGAFDSIDEYHRAQYFEMSDIDTSPFLDKIIRYANNYHAEKAAAQQSLFGAMMGGEPMLARPKAPMVTEWNQIEKLKFEKDVVGFYITGHPLDEFKLEMDGFCNCTLATIFETKQPEIKVGCIVSAVQMRVTKSGNPFCIFKVEDYNSSLEMALFGDDYVRLVQYIEIGRFLHITGKTQNKWGSEQLEFKPTSIRLLNDMREKFCKELRVSLTLDALNAQLVSKINELVNAHPGTCTLHLHVMDRDERIDISLQSRTLKVSPANSLMRALEAMEGVTCKVA
ncbi:DNA polymerase III subunit alpha [Spirosoma utsteinense]|uniref:DNA polymerase III subunit alpha n=1 Tax=Spirosoma utsteinense TaxID=2585773 RepID=A0ABR6W9H5_9BACT|nr:DNA polymerase III subunit alpha [Spirosoma utsteinense]MBC3783933.1 DNA polymerase-3 subunit alpha [Spirosoma utsteinense]MBC3792567.1 DNA polymerase-3 subunit alpha [Spirosoma utsteinense]